MSKKLLLADDSITIQKVIQITFAHEDYELTITDNGDAALSKAKEIKPDLVMSDVYMPGKNGYELTSAIRQDPELKHIPVLLLAGSFEPFDEDKARSCQANAWIEKPFESQNLIDKVAELLSAAVVVQPRAAEPEPIAAAAVEASPLPAFDEPLAVEPEMAAAAEDPFGDISFEEAPGLEAEPAPVAESLDLADDWSDVAAEPAVTAPVIEDVFAAEPVTELSDDFTFEEEADTTGFATVEGIPAVDADLDVFDMDDEEIMPLDEDDILGAEDLEPVLPEQTLASWSRSGTEAEEDIFAEPLEEMPALDEPPVFAEAAPVMEEAPPFVEEEAFVTETTLYEEPSQEEDIDFSEPAVAPLVASAPLFVEEEPDAAEPLKVAAKASAMTEDEIEQIIERVVTKVVEKLAGSILERVAWEVVPDLAENLIREEIRKIKDAAA